MADVPPRLLVFDLDGTLIDSRVDLCNSINAMLSHLEKPELPPHVISSYIGDGASMLVHRALGIREGELADEPYGSEALAYFLNHYREHKLDFTYVYPGVHEALIAIRKASPEMLMAILTNKPVNPSREIAAHFGLDRVFFQNYGGNSFPTKKPDPLGLLTLIAEASLLAGSEIAPAETIMIGDSDVDILTAKSCGAQSWGCMYGLAPHTLAAVDPVHLVHRPEQWLELLGILPLQPDQKP